MLVLEVAATMEWEKSSTFKLLNARNHVSEYFQGFMQTHYYTVKCHAYPI